MTATEDEFNTGQIVPGTRYRVVASIGQGGMGSVYEVEHVELGKRFVLKALIKDLSTRVDLVQRLRNEWRALGKLEHPSIVSVTDAGATPRGVPFYVMERLNGENLAHTLRRGPLPLERSLTIAAEVLEALDAAHRIGVVHRDVKPPNIFLTDQGATKLLDFGIAKLMDRAVSLTGKGVAIGTPRYMSPEQAAGGAIDARADLYAVGLVLFEMLTGQSPFEDCTPNQIFLAHLTRVAPRLSLVLKGVPKELEHLVVRLLEKKPEDRPPSAGAAASALRAMIRSYGGGVRRDTFAKPPEDALTPAFSARSNSRGRTERTTARAPREASGHRGTDTVHEDGPTKRAVWSPSPGVSPSPSAPRTEVLTEPEDGEPPTRTAAPFGVTPPPVSRSPSVRPRATQTPVERLSARRLLAIAGAATVAGGFLVLMTPWAGARWFATEKTAVVAEQGQTGAASEPSSPFDQEAQRKHEATARSAGEDTEPPLAPRGDSAAAGARPAPKTLGDHREPEEKPRSALLSSEPAKAKRNLSSNPGAPEQNAAPDPEPPAESPPKSSSNPVSPGGVLRPPVVGGRRLPTSGL